MGLREQIAMELRVTSPSGSSTVSRLDDVLRQFGDPRTLAESYLAAVPLRSAAFLPAPLRS